ncbi:hypothetical protein SAMN05445756_0968 [Kytococcus aerolatus]|uniref:Uncharacterized protein n=1 Tax=Kytococcus aerolatus TaxID=592308 RepID=A0A212TD38_9MICO|nr:hypothetical protein [Kytococcus aerolatus]SNC63734.1 hypothetical protein SAMN05445756_0968 [Kytococcus aerolatus]
MDPSTPAESPQGQPPAPVPVDALGVGGTETPVHHLPDLEQIAPHRGPGALRYSAPLPNGVPMETLFINRGEESRTLLVGLHGSTDRNKYTLPRFEWLRTVAERSPHSALFISDPTLASAPTLRLAWYTGWRDLDLTPFLAEQVRRAAAACGADEIVLLGSSGGGFAAMQVATLLPDSLAVAFNPQASIARYTPQAQVSYLKHVMPHLAEELRPAIDAGDDWSAQALGTRASLIERYTTEQPNFAVYVQNLNDDTHIERHYGAFRDAVGHGPNRGRLDLVEYEGQAGHGPPGAGRLLQAIEDGLVWRREALAREAGSVA